MPCYICVCNVLGLFSSFLYFYKFQWLGFLSFLIQRRRIFIKIFFFFVDFHVIEYIYWWFINLVSLTVVWILRTSGAIMRWASVRRKSRWQFKILLKDELLLLYFTRVCILFLLYPVSLESKKCNVFHSLKRNSAVH